MKPKSHEWTDRRRMMYIIFSFSILINVYGAITHPEASETSLISRICINSLETISLMFSGYVLGRVAEKHSSLRGNNDTPMDPTGSLEPTEGKEIS